MLPQAKMHISESHDSIFIKRLKDFLTCLAPKVAPHFTNMVHTI